MQYGEPLSSATHMTTVATSPDTIHPNYDSRLSKEINGQEQIPLACMIPYPTFPYDTSRDLTVSSIWKVDMEDGNVDLHLEV